MKSQIYLIESNDGFYKIGVSKEPNKRLKTLQTGNLNKLIIKQTFESEFAYKIEKALHRSYNRISGEWFELSKEEVDLFLLNCEKIHRSLTAINTIKIE